ncbi:MAG TPA: hypothetical protein VLF93_02095 [Candidatus Saccharimonadales bacterium]|nr:hypothetical protein [Candidatus Saccharimonadales bacterium]
MLNVTGALAGATIYEAATGGSPTVVGNLLDIATFTLLDAGILYGIDKAKSKQ